MVNISSNDYYYYLHKTLISNYDTVESLFNDGLKSRYGYSLHSTLFPIDEEQLVQKGLENAIVDYLGSSEEYNCVVVVKIPKRYFRDIIHRDGKMDPAVPMFREYTQEGRDWNSLFTPKLIQGIYCRDITKSFTNPNFNPVYDPSGCQFSDEQIRNFETYNSYDWRNYGLARRNYKFDQLYMSDKQNKSWEQIINHYSQLYGVKPTKMVQYEMTNDDKELFNNLHK